MYPKPKKPEKKETFKKAKIEVVNQVNPLVSIIKKYYQDNSTEELELFVNTLPPSTNNIYNKEVRFSVKQNRNIIHHSLHQDVEMFRNFIWAVVDMTVQMA